ncbi:MAG: stage II sporulation protein M [Saprospiraceae bacterium]|nr:stage II sporulation protein M [Saprospiraceae bacterium]
MKETKFIEQNKEKWADFEESLRERQHDPARLNELFVQITDDLSYARTFYPNRSVRMYLNTLAQRIFHNIYRGKRLPVERLRRFWTDELPQLFWLERRAFFLSFCVFALAFSIGVVSSIINPDFARIILGDEYVEMTVRNIEGGDPMAAYKREAPGGMTVSIAARNLFVAFQTAILGVLASIGTVFILLINGIMVGAFQYFFVEKGVFWDSFLTIWIHGTLEISAIIIAGASGLVAGSGLLFPGTYTRGQAFQISIRRGLKMFFGIVPIILLAAFFEGFFTRYTQTPDVLRAAFILTSLAFVLWYFVWLPRHKASTGGFHELPHDKEIPPDRAHAIDFKTIKSAGEIFSDTFTLLRRHPKTTLWGLFGTAALFVAFAFGLSHQDPASTFYLDSHARWPFNTLVGTAQFFQNDPVPFLFYFQTMLLVVLTIAAFRALEQEMAAEMRVPFSRKRMLLAVLPMLLPMLGFVFVFQLWEEGAAFLWGMAAYPFLALWSAVIYFETLNPLAALLRAFRLMRWGQGLTLGFLLVMLQVLLFMFIDTPIWGLALQLFSWLVPQQAGAMAAYTTIATCGAASVLLYFVFLMIALCGGLQYFSSREITDATSLFEGIEQVGSGRQIRGLARE